MKTIHLILAVICPLLMLTACSKNDEIRVACLHYIPPLFADFNVVSSQTNEDLFFSNMPTYEIKELFFFKIKDKLRKDTIRPDVVGAGAARYFKIRLNNLVPRDTLVLKIANNPDDSFIYTIKKTVEVCPNYILDKAFLNNKEIATDKGKLTLEKQPIF
jgi:hypothetical protein